MSRGRFRPWLGAAALLAALAAPAVAVGPGDPAPALEAPGLGGERVSLAAHRGKVVIVDFWASWCSPCAQALPAYDTLRRELPAEDFQVIAVNLDRESSAARAFLSRRPVGYPTALDPEGAIPARFGVETMPTSFMIDRQGVVRHVHRGFHPDDLADLRARVQRLVAAGR